MNSKKPPKNPSGLKLHGTYTPQQQAKMALEELLSAKGLEDRVSIKSMTDKKIKLELSVTEEQIESILKASTIRLHDENGPKIEVTIEGLSVQQWRAEEQKRKHKQSKLPKGPER